MASKEKLYYVYKHTSPNNKVYIGITSQMPQRRWKDDGSGYRNNMYFWRAIQKYGWNNFKHEVLYKNLTKEEACKKEKELILYYNSTDSKNGYNHSTGGDGGTEGIHRYGEDNPFYGKHHTEESKNKIRAKTLGRKDSEETKKKKSAATSGANNPRYGVILEETTKQKISDALKGNKPWMKGKHHTEKAKAKLSQAHKKEVLQFDKNINYINTYASLIDAEKATKVSRYNIAGCCRGDHPTAGGFIWAYKQDYESNPQMKLPQKKSRKQTIGKSVNQYDLNDNYIASYISISEAARQTNTDASGIGLCCKYKQDTAGGFIWRYRDDNTN